MDLDSALNELGMLSIVTESRRDYLKEKASRNLTNAASSANYHIVKMNPQFVTCVGSVVSSSSHRVSVIESNSPKNGVVEAEKSMSASRAYPPFLVNEHRVARTRRPSRRHPKQPYSVPWRPKASRSHKSKMYLSTSLEDDVFAEGPLTDCNGNGQKYRRPSTEAAGKATTLSVPPIALHRSKSLDDLHLERLRLDDGLSRHRSDVELASKLISNLQVS